MITTTTTTEQHLPNQISCAYDILDEEVTRTTAERDALRQFHAQCAQIDPDSQSPSTTTDATATDTTTSPSASQTLSTGLTGLTNMIRTRTQHTTPATSGALTQVHEAYRETVMALDHYDEEYDESLAVNLAAEVGDDLASAITSNERFPSQIKQNLDHAIQQCIASRTILLDDLDQEREALDTAETTITELMDWLRAHNERSLNEWSLTERYRLYETLEAHESHCDTVAAARQERVRSRRTTSGTPRADDRLFNAYLYESLSVAYPILADLATLGNLLREARQRLEETLVWA
jgi:hypothetical protein